MSYEPTIWKKGDKVTSTKLNKIEQGIVNNENEVSQLKSGFNELEGSVVKTVNGIAPDENGNVEVESGSGDTSDLETELFFDYETTSQDGFYYNNNHVLTYSSNSSYKTIITDWIPCKEGYKFIYDGKGINSIFSYAFADDNDTLTSAPVVASGTEIVVPSGVAKVKFQSYENTSAGIAPTLSVKRTYPIPLNDVVGDNSETTGYTWTKTATGAAWKPASGSENLDILNRINNVIPSEYPYTDIANGGYYVVNGVYKFLSNSSYKCRVSDKIPVFEGMEFVAVLNNAASAFNTIYFFNDDVFVSAINVSTKVAMYKKVTVPSGVNYMIAQSTANATDESFRWFLKRMYPHDANKDPLHGVKLTIIGDSISMAQDAFKIGYLDRLQNTNGMVIQNLARSGTGFSVGYAGETKYFDRIASIDSDTDIILVSGSFNDLNRGPELGTVDDMTESTIAGCMNLFFTELLANYPTKKMLIMTTNPWKDYHAGVEKSDNYVELLGKIADKYGIPYYPLYRKTNLRPWNETCKNLYFVNADGTHPNTEGHKELYNLLLPAIRNVSTVQIDNAIPEKAQ